MATPIQKKSSKSTTRWECTTRRTTNCKGSITTDLEIKDIIGKTEHNHDPDNVKGPESKSLSKCERISDYERHTSTDSRRRYLDVRAAIGQTDSVKRSIMRFRSKLNPPNPGSINDLIIPEEWTTTGGTDQKTFLFYDNGLDAESRMLVFAADESLKHLAMSDIWMMDGTFDTAKNIFSQVYVIRAPQGNTSVSCVYALLSDKRESTYDELLSAVVTKCSELGFDPDPTTVILDFEKAVMNSITITFGPHVLTRGCFYHLSQSTWRKIQSLGLVSLYKQNEAVEHFCGMLDGLAFLPIDDVTSGLQYLREIAPDGLEPLVDYFDATYVSGTFRKIKPSTRNGVLQPLRMRRVPPLFLPSKWNVNEATVEGDSRTNNMCEAWNRGFSSLVGHAHPTVWTFIDAIRKDFNQVECALYSAERGEPPKKRVRQETKKLQERLKNICVSVNTGKKDLFETLNTVGHCIRFK